MGDVTKILRDIGVEPTMTEATVKRFEWFRDLEAVEYFSNIRPEEWQKVAELWDRKNPNFEK